MDWKVPCHGCFGKVDSNTYVLIKEQKNGTEKVFCSLKCFENFCKEKKK